MISNLRPMEKIQLKINIILIEPTIAIVAIPFLGVIRISTPFNVLGFAVVETGTV